MKLFRKTGWELHIKKNYLESILVRMIENKRSSMETTNLLTPSTNLC